MSDPNVVNATLAQPPTGGASLPPEADDSKPLPLTRADITKSWLLWWVTAEMSNSFERLQTLAFCACMIPILRKLYRTKQSLSEALSRHLVFFNTQGNWGCIIHGITIAMEEQKAKGQEVPDEAVIGIKTGLMGPFAGIGDSIDWGTLKPLIIGLFVPVAMSGSVIGSLGPVLVFPCVVGAIGYILWHKGYKLGRESIMAVLAGGWIKKLMTAAGVLGLFMMGALSANFVKLSTPLKLSVAGQNVVVQSVLDSIVPGLLPILVVFAMYAFLLRRGPRFIQILVLVLIGAVITSVLHIF